MKLKDLLDEDLELTTEEKSVIVMFLFMVVVFSVMITGLVVWGIGNLIILAFGINAFWHYWQSVVVAIVLFLIKLII